MVAKSKASTGAKATSGDAAKDVQKCFAESQYDFVRSLQRAEAEAQKNLAEDERSFQEKVQSIERKAWERLNEAFDERNRALSELAEAEDAQIRVVEVERAFWGQRLAIENEARQQLGEAAEERQKALLERVEEARRHQEKIRHGYVAALRGCWTGLDPEDLDWNDLAIVSNQTQAAISLAQQFAFRQFAC